MSQAILGISAYYHDSAAALLVDGDIVAAAHEERFTRKKHDSSFPGHAVRFALDHAGITLRDLAAVAFYEKPYLKFERLLETYHGLAPRGLTSFLSAMPVWIKEKLFMRKLINDELLKIGPDVPRLLFPEHHLSHAASAFYPSPFDEAAILTIDGVGEWATTTICHGSGPDIKICRELDFPHSLGLFYSAVTYYCGFKVNSGEYKLMGLAPYGHADGEPTRRFRQQMRDHLIDIRPDGSLLLNMDYFNFAAGLTMCHEKKWEHLFGMPQRLPETELAQPYMNFALAAQQLTEEVMLLLAATAQELTASRNLVLAGGVALNCVANGRLLRSGMFDDIWIQPAAGDAGGAVGAAYAAWFAGANRQRCGAPGADGMSGAFLGPEYSATDILKLAKRHAAPCREYADFAELCNEVAGLLARGAVVGWLQGRMEFGPRALGNRSILGSPCLPDMQKKLNLKIKYREGFRPFAPAVLEEDVAQYFELDRPSAYMLFTAPVREQHRIALPADYDRKPLYDRLYCQRSDIPAVTHIDYSARIQTISKKTNERFWKLLTAFKNRTGCSVLVNTSFNVRGEPIVCTPEDAYRCFMRTEMDYLVLGDYLFEKSSQPGLKEAPGWQQLFQLD